MIAVSAEPSLPGMMEVMGRMGSILTPPSSEVSVVVSVPRAALAAGAWAL